MDGIILHDVYDHQRDGVGLRSPPLLSLYGVKCRLYRTAITVMLPI